MGRPKGSANVPWQAIVDDLRSTPNLWRALPEMVAVPERTIRVIREKERRALRLDDGVIRVRVKAKAPAIFSEQIVCTLFLKFEKKEVPSGTDTQG